MKTEVEFGGSFSDPNFDLCFANQEKMKCIVIFLCNFRGSVRLENTYAPMSSYSTS